MTISSVTSSNTSRTSRTSRSLALGGRRGRRRFSNDRRLSSANVTLDARVGVTAVVADMRQHFGLLYCGSQRMVRDEHALRCVEIPRELGRQRVRSCIPSTLTTNRVGVRGDDGSARRSQSLYFSLHLFIVLNLYISSFLLLLLVAKFEVSKVTTASRRRALIYNIIGAWPPNALKRNLTMS